MNVLLKQKTGAPVYFLIIADLFKTPDEELWQDMMDGQFFEKLKDLAAETCDTPDSGYAALSDAPKNLQEMKRTYFHTIGASNPNAVCPIESLYKPWTTDSTCELPFAKSKGYLLGDSALHIRFLLDQFDMEIPEDYLNTPDHLVILLELLAFFVEHAPADFTRQFIEDHFNWLDDFAERLENLPGSQFYLQLTRLLQKMLV